MFGVRFIKVQPTDYVLQYRRGRVVRAGAGLAFFWFAPTSSLVLIPVGSVEVPFMFEEVTADFQSVTVQGQLTYRVVDPNRLAGLMNFTLAAKGRGYESEDPLKLPQRLVTQVQVLTRAALKAASLRAALGQVEDLGRGLRDGLAGAAGITSLGVEVLDLSILAIRPTPETARALEAETRERILREADEAVYARRNAAVEQERAIKENELNTEIAVENKKRQIRETQLEAEKAAQLKLREIRETEMATRIATEQQNQTLVGLATANARLEADARAHAVAVVMQALSGADPRTVQALAAVGMDSGQLVAAAFRDLAGSGERIGQLNVSPELLRELLQRQPTV